MKIRLMVKITAIVCAVSICVGLYCKSHYKDFNEEENPLEQFTVGLLSDQVVDAQIKMLEDTAEDQCEIIAAVRCEEKFKFSYSSLSQKVSVVRVFKGDEVKEGSAIEIMRACSDVYLDGYGDGKMSANLNFVNEMVPGKTYLVFIDRKLKNSEAFLIGEEYIIPPIFCYEDIPNKAADSLDGEINYTGYIYVKDNEYFFNSDESYQKMKKFKEELIEKYKL